MRKLFLLAVCFALFGCATSEITRQSFMEDDALKRSAISLAGDYLEGQMGGDDGSQFGKSLKIENLLGWEVGETDYLWDGDYVVTPAVHCKLRMEDGAGAVDWNDYVISLDYDASLRSKGDEYNGLRIRSIRAARSQ